MLLLTSMFFSCLQYLNYLLPISAQEKKWELRISVMICALFALISAYVILSTSDASWEDAIVKTINELFLYSSLGLFAIGVSALFYIRKMEKPEHRRLLVGVIYSFVPLAAYFTLDILFLKNAPFKLTMLAYTTFAINMYLYISRVYMHNYDLVDDAIKRFIKNQAVKYSLSQRECDMLELIVSGHTNQEMAQSLYISINTVKTHIRNLYKKLNVKNRMQLIKKVNSR